VTSLLSIVLMPQLLKSINVLICLYFLLDGKTAHLVILDCYRSIAVLNDLSRVFINIVIGL
jgi:hypothetical protein